jgi:Anti-sigma-K factor rskA
VRRRVVLLLVLSAAAAAVIVYELRRRSHQLLSGRDPWTTFGEPSTVATAPPPSPEIAHETPPRESGAPREEAPTEAPAMVAATMEATPALDEARFGTSGAGATAVEPDPAKIASEAAPSAIERTSIEQGFTGRAAQERPETKRRLSGATLAALGALAGAAAIALGAWGIAASVSDDDEPARSPAALQNVQQVVSLIAKPTTSTIPLQGSGRRIILVVGARGYGVLVLNAVNPPPVGKTYQAWVIRPNVKTPQPAGLFSGGTGVVKLTKPVPPGAVVAITVEQAGGAPAPTQQPKLVATRT